MSNQAGKGSKRRPTQVSEKELDRKWNQIFKNKKSLKASQAPLGEFEDKNETDSFLIQEDQFGNKIVINKKALESINFGVDKSK